ncbi:MAG TPA: glycosyltransferase family 2 protein [archaeon]|nr:glycosyltransferase family 2 protein [archaeon]
MSTDLSTLVTNLKLIRFRYPSVHHRLNQKVVSGVLDGLYHCEDGRYAYLVQDEKRHKILIKESSRRIDISGKRLIILLGIGLGYQLFEIFRQLSANQLLIAVETRPDLLCKSLYVHDWQELLNSPQFKLFLGCDIHGLSEFAEQIISAPEEKDLMVLDNKVLVTIDQKPYSWWNAYFYLIKGLSYDGIRVINAVMSRFNLWDPDNLYLNMPSDFLGKKISELDPKEIYGRFNLLARTLAPSLRTMRLKDFPRIKDQIHLPPKGRVSIIVLCWNKVDYTRRCLNSLLQKTDYPDFKVIAVDNGSTDKTRDLLLSLARKDKRLQPVNLPRNLGIPSGRQAGLELADGEFILFMDNDTEVERPDFLSVMVNTLENDPNIGSTGAFPIVYTHDKNDHYIQCVYIPGIIAPVAWCSGYCLIVRRSVLEDIGGIDAEEFEAYGTEDVYLGYKLREHGWITVSTPQLVGVTHLIAHRLDHYDYDWLASGRKNSELFFRTFGPRRRLLDAARDNRIASGLWDKNKQKFV